MAVQSSKSKLPKSACETCGTMFQPARSWQRFCKDACRDAARQEDLSVENVCAYCGLLALTVDHVPPRSVRSTLIGLGFAQQYPFIEVRCCSECNSALSDRPLWTVAQRKEFIKTWIERRYQKYLKIPTWTEAQLLELGHELQQRTRHGIAVRELTLRRLQH